MEALTSLISNNFCWIIEVEGGVSINKGLDKDNIVIAEDARMTSLSCKGVLDLLIFLVVMKDIGD